MLSHVRFAVRSGSRQIYCRAGRPTPIVFSVFGASCPLVFGGRASCPPVWPMVCGGTYIVRNLADGVPVSLGGRLNFRFSSSLRMHRVQRKISDSGGDRWVLCHDHLA